MDPIDHAALPFDLAELERMASTVALGCGRLIADERPDHLGVDHTKSSAVDAVTVMDQRSEALASKLLRELRPDDAQYGEEGLRSPGTSGITWVVDPIDGTVNYLYRIPAYAVSVAAVLGDPGTEGGWRPVAGAVVNPETGELFSAHLGGGSRCTREGNVRTLRFSPASTLAGSLVATGFSYEASLRAEQGAVIARLLPQVRDIRRLGSAALDLCHLADGRHDAYFERRLHPWDMAAGWLVATEAGATVRGLAGAGPGTTMTMAGAADIVDQLEAIIAAG